MNLSICSSYCDTIYHRHLSAVSVNNITDLSTPTWGIKAEHPVGMVPGDDGVGGGGAAGGADNGVRDALVEVAEDLDERACDPRRRGVQWHDVVGGGGDGAWRLPVRRSRGRDGHGQAAGAAESGGGGPRSEGAREEGGLHG